MAVALLAVGGGLMAYGQVRQGQLAEAEGKAQKKIADFNAEQLDRQAKSRQQAAAIEEQRVSRQSKMFMGKQRAEFAKSGLTMEGSALEVLSDTAYQFSMDRNLTLRQGLLDADYMRSQGAIQRVQGKWAREYGKQQKTSSYLSAAGTAMMTAYTAGQAMSATGAGSAANQQGLQSGTIGSRSGGFGDGLRTYS